LNTTLKSKEVIYPQSKDDKAPKNYSLGMFCGSRGSGNIYLFTISLKFQKKRNFKKAYLDDKIVKARSAQRRRSQPAFIMIMIMKLVSTSGVPQRIILVSSTANSDSNLIFKN
jgi:hypothetical protein